MIVILLVVYTKGLKGFSGIAIGGIIGLDIFFFGFISGASMNPARSLAPALLSGLVGDYGYIVLQHLLELLLPQSPLDPNLNKNNGFISAYTSSNYVTRR